ncbi:MAG TPA: class I SAM-dependent methyltransferase [Thermodesulfobacteriota bacterium]
MLRNTQNRIPSRCFICGGDFSRSRFAALDVEGSRYEVLFCDGCGLGKTEPFLSEDELSKIYSSSYRREDSTRFPAFLERIISVVRDNRRRSVERYARKGRILDVGCGRGDFLLKMLGKGWECFGLELDERVSRHNRPGMELKYGSLSSHRFPDARFEAVTFWHVFEHLRDPEWALAECARILKPGGLLVVAVPNMESLQSRLSGRGWFHLDPPFHLYHYSARNIRTLLEKSGFEVLAQKHFSFEYNPYGYIQSFYNRLGLSQNQLYEFLRSRSGKSAALVFTIATLPVVAILSLLLSGAEALLRAGGTIEVYARKKG